MHSEDRVSNEAERNDVQAVTKMGQSSAGSLKSLKIKGW